MAELIVNNFGVCTLMGLGRRIRWELRSPNMPRHFGGMCVAGPLKSVKHMILLKV